MDLYDDIPPPSSSSPSSSKPQITINTGAIAGSKPTSFEIKKPFIGTKKATPIIPIALLSKNVEKKQSLPTKPISLIKPPSVIAASAASSSSTVSNNTSNMTFVSSSSSTVTKESKEGGQILDQIKRANEEMEIVLDEYDPFHPNDFEQYLKEKSKLSNTTQFSYINDFEQQIANNITSNNEQPKDDFASRLMKKYGWKEGQGLGKDAQGMIHPLITKKTDKGTGGIIINQHAALQLKNPPSPVILIENMVDISEVDDELAGEVKGECEKYGKVNDVKIIEVNPVKVFVEYGSNTEANVAISKLNGRFFGGKKISAKLYPREFFIHKQYDIQV